MKIGTIGAGSIGGTLGKLWAANGHAVLFSSRHPDSDAMKTLLAEAGDQARAGTIAEAIAFADVILLAMPGDALESLLDSLGDLNGKIVVDATNRFDGKSNAQTLMERFPDAKIVKAFNTVSAEMVLDPVYGDQRATLIYAGHPDGKAAIRELIEVVGFELIDAGDEGAIAALEAYTRGISAIWFNLAANYGRRVAFQVLK